MTTENRLEENKMDRVPVSGMRDILTVMNKDENFVYRFVKDVDEQGSRIQRFLRGGYEFERVGRDSNISVGADAVYKSRRKDVGSIIRYPGDSHGTYLYLMKIRKDWYEEDQKAKQDKIDEVEDLMKGKKTSDENELGQYGSMRISRD